MKVKAFLPFSKIEDLPDGAVYVEGIATSETVDHDGEVVMYDASRAAFDGWTEEFSRATDGESLGNIREMHGDSAAGKAVSYFPDDASRTIRIGSKIVDPVAVAKVRERVYTGYSIGGNEVKRGTVRVGDRDVRAITGYKLVELSLVDKPSCPDALFSLAKRDEVEKAEEPETRETPVPPNTPPTQDAGPPTLTPSPNPTLPEVVTATEPEPVAETADETEVVVTLEADETTPPAPEAAKVEVAALVAEALAPVLAKIADMETRISGFVADALAYSQAPKSDAQAELSKVADAASKAAEAAGSLDERLSKIEAIVTKIPAPAPGRSVEKVIGGTPGSPSAHGFKADAVEKAISALPPHEQARFRLALAASAVPAR